MSEAATLRFKPMDVVFADYLWRPRMLILEVHPVSRCCTYTTCGETGGIGYLSGGAVRTKEEWLAWIDRFSDDLTGRDLREAKEAAAAEFTEPADWIAFRKRYAETGDPFINNQSTNQNNKHENKSED